MTQDEIILMARDAASFSDENVLKDWMPFLERFAALVAAHEREACVKVCEENAKEWADGNNDWCSGQVTGSNDCAAAIRAR